MGLLQYLKDKKLDYDINKLGRLLKVMEQRFQFNAYRTYVPASLMASDKINKTLVECLVWYSGDIAALLEWYRNNPTDDQLGAFWNVVGDRDRKIHSGLPQLIVNKMPTIIFGSGYSINPVVYTEDGAINEEQTNRAKDVLAELMEKLEIHSKLMQGEEKKSWSGHLAVKISFDLTLTPYPIVEMYDRRYFDIVKRRGITQGIIFKTYYDLGENKYTLKEYYTTNENGYARIESHLYGYNKEAKEVEMELATIPQTATIEPIVDLEIKGMLAFELANIVPKDLINGNPYGESDINSFSTYDSLDEVMTAIVQEIRDNKTIRYIPESMIPKDANGDFRRLNKMVTNYIKTESDIDQNAKREITTTFINDKTMEHFEKYKILITNACNQAELSPLSLGITGLESISSSDKSTRERAKVTLEMRNKKVVLWRAFLKTFVTQLLISWDWLNDNRIGLDYDRLDVNVTFNDYIGSSQEERLALWGNALTQGVASIDMAVNKIHQGELTEEEIQEEINKIRFEKGMSVDTPETLQIE